MENPLAKELFLKKILKKIQELEAGLAQLKQEMSRLKLSDSRPYQHTHQRSHQRSHSVSPEPEQMRLAASTRRSSGGAGFEARSAWQQGSASFPHSSPESHSLDPPDEVNGNGGPTA